MVAAAQTMLTKPTPAMAFRQPSASATEGSKAAVTTQPTGTAACFIPMTVPQTRDGNQSTIALVTAGSTPLLPTPAANITNSACWNVDAWPIKISDDPITAKPTAIVILTPNRSVRVPATNS